MNLVLTFDYELFGDGSGNVFKHMIEPTKQIFSICDEYGIKTTLFFEVVEYWRLKEQWNKGNTMDYDRDPIKAIENQLQKAVLQGHEIQLHVHPQWMNAEWQNDHWQMDMDNWRLGDFSLEDYTIEDLLRDGKKTIEQIVRHVQPDYECIALRAGAYNIMPSRTVFDAMQKVGLKIDSSVYPYGYEQGALSKYDYRSVSVTKDYWWADPDDVTMEAQTDSNIMEIPVFALPQRRIHKLLNITKLKSLLKKREEAFSAVAKSKFSDKLFFEKITFLFGEEAFTWDFCLFSKQMHKKFFRYIEEKLAHQRDMFVIIGHPKSYQSDRSLKSLIKLAGNRKHNYSFETLRKVSQDLKHQ